MMKKYFFIVVLVLMPTLALSKVKCDQACWLERWYQLQTMRVLNSEKRAQQHAQEAQRQEKERAERMQHEHKMRLLQQTKKRCEEESLEDATYSERSLCNAVQGFFDYGIEVPDSMLAMATQ